MSKDLDKKILRYCYNMPWPAAVSEEELVNKFSDADTAEESVEMRIEKLFDTNLLHVGSDCRCTSEGVQVLSNYESIETTEKLREQEMRSSAVETIFTIALLIFTGVQVSSVINVEYVVLAVGAITLWALLIGGRNIVQTTRISLKNHRKWLISRTTQ